MTHIDGLRRMSRLRALTADGSGIRMYELLLLALVGASAALATTFVHFGLRIPGHSIILAAFPMAFGFALVPRRGAGVLMGSSAALTTTLLHLLGFRIPGLGALTSLHLTGPMLDLALYWGRRGWRLHASFVIGCAIANGLAFLVRAAAKLFGLSLRGIGRPFDEWLPIAVGTYVLAGLIAGLVSAAAWFHLRGGDDPPDAVGRGS